MGLDDLGLESQQGQEIYLFSKTSRLALGATQPPTEWALQFFLWHEAAGSQRQPLTSI